MGDNRAMKAATTFLVLTTSVAALARAQTAAGPTPCDLALRRAEAEIAAGHSAAAERHLRAAAERCKSVRALLQLARLLSSNGDTAGAVRALEQARKMAPNSEEVLSTCAQSWLTAKDPVRGLVPLEALVRMYPAVADYRYLRGVATLQTGDAVGALEELREADRLEPRRAPTLAAMGVAQNQLQRFPEAAASLREALALEPENVEAGAALARSEEGQGRLDEAEATARRVLARAPDHGAANLVLGSVLMKRGAYSQACEALERAVAAEPSAKAHYQLSLAYSRLGDDTRAGEQRALYEKAARAEEERLRALGRLGGMAGRGILE